jgi:hypothetical protein
VAEVASLVRLEPDNAGALQYAVALAQAKHDDAALDEALARMASATRADDHLGDEIAEWRKVYMAHPEGNLVLPMWSEAPASERALLGALNQTSYRASPVQSALAQACTPDGDSERTWQRLGWCVGGRRAPRRQGQQLRPARCGPQDARRGGRDAVRRRRDWLKANSANPMSNSEAVADAPADVAADWRGAKGDVAATKRRLERLGKPATPPSGWDAKRHDAARMAEAEAQAHTWTNYSRDLLDAMEASSDACTRVLALASAPMRAIMAATTSKSDAGADPAADAKTALADFAAAHPDDAFVQWMAATQGDAPARTRLQRLEPDNAAAWALSLTDTSIEPKQTLERMASGRRHSQHVKQAVDLWLAAVRKFPPPADLHLAGFVPTEPDSAKVAFSVDDRAAMAASVFATMSAMGGSEPFAALMKNCVEKSPHCVTIGRTLSDRSDTLIGTRLGYALLSKQHAMTAADIASARRLDWWQEGMRSLSTSAEALAYLRDSIAHGEIGARARSSHPRTGDRQAKNRPSRNPRSGADIALRAVSRKEYCRCRLPDDGSRTLRPPRRRHALRAYRPTRLGRSRCAFPVGRYARSACRRRAAEASRLKPLPRPRAAACCRRCAASERPAHRGIGAQRRMRRVVELARRAGEAHRHRDVVAGARGAHALRPGEHTESEAFEDLADLALELGRGAAHRVDFEYAGELEALVGALRADVVEVFHCGQHR